MPLSEEYLPYVEAFLEETREQLQVLEKLLVSLERDPDDHECLENIFRIVHTLKGNAATVGHKEMARLAHHMENLLDSVRRGKTCPSGEITEILLTSLDALNGLADEACGNKEYDSDLVDVVARIEALASDETGPGSSAKQKEEQRTYRVVVTLDESCIMRAARACVIVNNLKELGEFAEIRPSLDELQSLDFKGIQIKARLVSEKSPDFITGVLQTVPEVRTAEVFLEESENRKSEAMKQRIEVGARIDMQTMAEYMKEAHIGGVIIDLTDISELSPAGLNWLLEVRESTGVELVLPQHPTHRRFFEFLGFGGHEVAVDDLETREAWQMILSRFEGRDLSQL